MDLSREIASFGAAVNISSKGIAGVSSQVNLHSDKQMFFQLSVNVTRPEQRSNNDTINTHPLDGNGKVA